MSDLAKQLATGLTVTTPQSERTRPHSMMLAKRSSRSSKIAATVASSSAPARLTTAIVETRGDLRFGEERDVSLKGLTGSWRVSPLIWAS